MALGISSALPSPAAKRSFAVLLTGSFVNSFGGFVLPFLSLYALHKGVRPSLAGLPATGYGAGAVIAAIIGGGMSDRVGGARTIAVSMIGSALAMAALGTVSNLPLLVFTAGLAGGFGNMFRPAVGSLIAGLASGPERASLYAAYRFSLNLGSAAGVAIAGFIADQSFTVLIIGDAATSLVFAALAAFALPHVTGSTSRTSNIRRGKGVIFRDRPFAVFLIGVALAWLVYYQVYSGLPLRIHQLGYPSHVLGVLLALESGLVVVIELPLTRWTRQLPGAAAIAAGVAFIGLGFMLLGIAQSVIILAACVMVWAVGEMLVSPLGAAYSMEMAPRSSQGQYQGAWNLTRSVGMLAAPIAGTAAFGLTPAVLWIGCGGCGLIGTCLVMASRLMPRRRVSRDSHAPESEAEKPSPSPERPRASG